MAEKCSRCQEKKDERDRYRQFRHDLLEIADGYRDPEAGMRAAVKAVKRAGFSRRRTRMLIAFCDGVMLWRKTN